MKNDLNETFHLFCSPFPVGPECWNTAMDSRLIFGSKWIVKCMNLTKLNMYLSKSRLVDERLPFYFAVVPWVIGRIAYRRIPEVPNTVQSCLPCEWCHRQGRKHRTIDTEFCCHDMNWWSFIFLVEFVLCYVQWKCRSMIPARMVFSWLRITSWQRYQSDMTCMYSEDSAVHRPYTIETRSIRKRWDKSIRSTKSPWWVVRYLQA